MRVCNPLYSKVTKVSSTFLFTIVRRYLRKAVITSIKFHCRDGFMRDSSPKPDIPVSLSGTLKLLVAGFVVMAFCLIFPFLPFLFCGLDDCNFCSNATLIRSMASSEGTNLWKKVGIIIYQDNLSSYIYQ